MCVNSFDIIQNYSIVSQSLFYNDCVTVVQFSSYSNASFTFTIHVYQSNTEVTSAFKSCHSLIYFIMTACHLIKTL